MQDFTVPLAGNRSFPLPLLSCLASFSFSLKAPFPCESEGSSPQRLFLCEILVCGFVFSYVSPSTKYLLIFPPGLLSLGYGAPSLSKSSAGATDKHCSARIVSSDVLVGSFLT